MQHLLEIVDCFLFPRGFDYEVNEKGLLKTITPCQCLPKTENTSLAISGIQFSCPTGWVDEVSEEVIWLCVRCSFCHLRHCNMQYAWLTEKRGRDLSQRRMSSEPNRWPLQGRKVGDPAQIFRYIEVSFTRIGFLLPPASRILYPTLLSIEIPYSPQRLFVDRMEKLTVELLLVEYL